MGDQEDVRSRVDEALRRAASVAYEAAHGSIDERPRDEGPSRWRVLLHPRAAATAVLAVGLLAVIVTYGPWVARGEAAAFSAAATLTPAPSPAHLTEGETTGGPGGPPGSTVVVDVAGAVARPNVLTLDAGSRVTDAIEGAGGALEEADLALLNLARVLVDGEQVFVPRVGEAGAAQAGSAVGADGRVNVNRADATALEELPGVGPVLAQRIVEFREANGPFGSVDDLDAVKGVGPSVLEGLADAATV